MDECWDNACPHSGHLVWELMGGHLVSEGWDRLAAYTDYVTSTSRGSESFLVPSVES